MICSDYLETLLEGVMAKLGYHLRGECLEVTRCKIDHLILVVISIDLLILTNICCGR